MKRRRTKVSELKCMNTPFRNMVNKSVKVFMKRMEQYDMSRIWLT